MASDKSQLKTYTIYLTEIRGCEYKVGHGYGLMTPYDYDYVQATLSKPENELLILETIVIETNKFDKLKDFTLNHIMPAFRDVRFDDDYIPWIKYIAPYIKHETFNNEQFLNKLNKHPYLLIR